MFTLCFSIITMGFFGRFLGTKGVLLIANLFMFICFLISCFCFFETSLSGSLVMFKFGIWFDSEFFFLRWGFLFDSITTSSY